MALPWPSQARSNRRNASGQKAYSWLAGHKHSVLRPRAACGVRAAWASSDMSFLKIATLPAGGVSQPPPGLMHFFATHARARAHAKQGWGLTKAKTGRIPAGCDHDGVLQPPRGVGHPAAASRDRGRQKESVCASKSAGCAGAAATRAGAAGPKPPRRAAARLRPRSPAAAPP
jgi:hypothetical protein